MEKKIYLITSAFFFSFMTFLVSAEETQHELTLPEVRNRIRIIRPKNTKDIDLSSIGKVGMVLNSSYPLHGDTLRDLLTLILRDAGYTFVDRTKFQEIRQQHLADKYVHQLEEQLEIAKQLKEKEFETTSLDILERRLQLQLEQAKTQQSTQREHAGDIIKIGKQLGLDAIITGTAFEGKRQLHFGDTDTPRTMESIVVSSFHLQILHVQSQQVVLGIYLNLGRGACVMDAADIMGKHLIEELK